MLEANRYNGMKSIDSCSSLQIAPAMRDRQCKIVATLGPASDPPERLRSLFDVGVDAFRLNFSHGSQDDHARRIDTIRKVEATTGRPITVLADLQGPKIRVGPFDGGGIDLRFRDTLTLEASDAPGGPGIIRLPHPELFEVLEPGDLIKLDDGLLQLLVQNVSGSQAEVRVEIPGRLTDRKGVNLPGRALPISPLTEKDHEDLRFALDAGVDVVALSFVQRPEDMDEARAIVGNRASLLAKIEKPAAVDVLDAIVARSDAVMVARGDLGVELPPEQVPVVQRRIIRECRRTGKPVIVATQMLQSMVEQASPTRAEASDVANAVYSGADAVMLSAESAVGRHPQTAVAIMDRIIKAAEADDSHWRDLAATREITEPTEADAVSLSAWHIANLLDCAAVLAATKTGSTALSIARQRPRAPILCLTADPSVARRLSTVWGVHSVVTPDIASFEDLSGEAANIARREGVAKPGERIVLTAGVPFGVPGSTNTLKIVTVD